MSDVKRFTGFIAIDGTTHGTEKSAVLHSRETKVKAALQALVPLVALDAPGVSRDDRDNAVIFPEDLPTFLSANREAVLAAFNQEVLTRKKRTPKPKTPTVSPTTPANTVGSPSAAP